MIAEHRAVVARGRRRTTPTRAESALRHHLRMVLSRAPRASAQQHPDYFEED